MCCGRRNNTPVVQTDASGNPVPVWLVTRPDGTTSTVYTEISAKMLAASVPGTTITQTTSNAAG